jgi:glycosyltransferase involved in cell wall biosynthesis
MPTEPWAVGEGVGRLRIGVVTPGYPPEVGGIEAVVGHLSAALAQKDHCVRVVAQRPRSSTLRSGMSAPNIDVARFPDWTGTRHFRVAPGLWRYLRKEQGSFDILHAHSFHGSVALAASTMASGPVVFTPHYHGVGHTVAARAVHLAYDRYAARIFDRSATVICVSNAEAELVARDYPRAQAKIVIIPNGIDIDGIYEAVPLQLDRPVILVAGRLDR